MKVLIIVPPYGPVEYPVLGPSLLKAVLHRAGIDCSLYYGSIEFAGRIGFGSYYQTYWSDAPLLIGERTFSRALFGESIPSLERFWSELVAPLTRKVLPGIDSHTIYEQLLEGHLAAEREALRFVDDLAASPRVVQSDVIGFSSSYGQNVASLAIARRIRARHREKILVMGGANCEGSMGEQLLRSFPFLDYVVSGPAESSFPELVSCLERGRAPAVAGVFARGPDHGELRGHQPAPPVDLDELPYPDYSDFFSAYDAHPENRKYIYSIPVEGARGCWWGEKQHCIFCGINGTEMAFRRKSAERYHREINALVRRYGISRVWSTDNILDHRYFKDLIPMLQKEHAYQEMFFEVKANLKKERLAALHEAGITRLQPGIESLSNPVLKLMKKGVTTFQNLQLLKWAEELGLTLQWNILCGFPGEEPSDYAAMNRILELIPHLPPPKSCSQITIDRFSPLFDDPAAHGVSIAPFKSYRYVYAMDSAELSNIAYFFSQKSATNDTTESLDVPPYAEQTFRQRKIWDALYGRVRFEYEVLADGTVRVRDSRPVAVRAEHRLSGLDAEIFLLTDKAMTLQSICRGLNGASRRRAPGAEEVEARLAALVDLNYLYRENRRYLCLATCREASASCH